MGSEGWSLLVNGKGPGKEAHFWCQQDIRETKNKPFQEEQGTI